jgi:transposase
VIRFIGVYPVEGMVSMIVIGVDAHKQTHTCAAVDELTGREIRTRTVAARDAGHGQLLDWAHGLGRERVWAVEDCRHVSGRLERFLLARGERVLRIPPKLMAGARKSSRESGKSDPIDALAVARAALREGLDSFPAAQLDEQALEIRHLVDHRERLVGQRTALINDLRWHLHDLDPDLHVPLRRFHQPIWQQRAARQLARMRGRRAWIAKDELARIRELSRAIKRLESELKTLVVAYQPHLLTLPGCGVLSAAKAIGETGRFATAAKFARITGTAPVKASSGTKDRHRLDRGGNRQLNAVLHRIALTQIRCHPPAIDYYQRKLTEGKTHKEALRCLKRQLANTLWHLLLPDQPPAPLPPPRARRPRTPHAVHCNPPMPSA